MVNWFNIEGKKMYYIYQQSILKAQRHNPCLNMIKLYLLPLILNSD